MCRCWRNRKQLETKFEPELTEAKLGNILRSRGNIAKEIVLKDPFMTTEFPLIYEDMYKGTHGILKLRSPV